MSVIASVLRDRRLEAAWVVFSAANLIILPRLGHWETIPFHLVWVTLTLLYGLRVWGIRSTMLILILVSVVSGTEMSWMAAQGRGEWAEVTEVPLMAAMFLAMVLARSQAPSRTGKRAAVSRA